MEDIGCLRRESRWFLIVIYLFIFSIVTTLVPPPFSVLGPYYVFKLEYPFFHFRRMEGVYSEKSVEGVGSPWVTEESSDFSVTE